MFWVTFWIQLAEQTQQQQQQQAQQQQQIQQQPQSKVIEASGHFANNQIENDSVSWIQGGLWHLVVYN
ncbi:MAG: hypothetical protein JO297_06170 [Nitrososphaeraceae archaeon]|nr:hypothetical protein [Nitrososphaeraceae archaeon]